MQIETLIGRARIQACRLWPVMQTPIMSLQPHLVPGIGTCAVDARMRLYVDPEFFSGIDDQYRTFLIQHEVLHPMLGHHRRGMKLNLEQNDRRLQFLWNVAADIAIHQLMAAEKLWIPDVAMTADKFQLPEKLSAEEYYRLLLEKKGSDKDGDGPPKTSGHTSGSGADGVQREWELSLHESAIGDAEKNSGLGEHEIESLQKEVAEAESRSRGNKAGDLSKIADYLLPPKVTPAEILRGIIAKAVNLNHTGSQFQSYQRPARRPSFSGLTRPSSWRSDLKIAIIVDTSGSMNAKDTALALGLIQSVLRSLHCSGGVRVITGDVQAARDAKVFHAHQVKAIGGGGTDMGAIIDSVMESRESRVERPDVLIVATDGYTPWPSSPKQCPVVATLTRSNQQSKVPSWIRSVCINE